MGKNPFPSINPGDTFQFVFVTGTPQWPADGTDATAPSIHHYNNFVKNNWNDSSNIFKKDLDREGVYDISWVCIGSTVGTNAVENIAGFYTDAGSAKMTNFKGIFRLDGALVVDSSNGLWETTTVPLHNYINIMRTGLSVGGPVWTGTAADGTTDLALGNGGATATAGTINGGPNFTTNWVSYGLGAGVLARFSLYAISEVLTVTEVVPHPHFIPPPPCMGAEAHQCREKPGPTSIRSSSRARKRRTLTRVLFGVTQNKKSKCFIYSSRKSRTKYKKRFK